MATRFTISQLKKLKAEGLIRDFKVIKAKEESSAGGRIVAKVFMGKSQEKNWISETLLTWCNERALILQEEYKFHEKRKWRFDWCIESLKVGFEYEGIFSEQSRHTNRNGYSKDAEKYNAAVSLGWRVFRYTAINYKNIENDLKTIL
jgi:hypothetical protein